MSLLEVNDSNAILSQYLILDVIAKIQDNNRNYTRPH